MNVKQMCNAHRLIICISAFLFSGCVKAQKFETLYGEWQVENNFILQHIGSETQKEYDERMKKQSDCLKSTITIDGTGIKGKDRLCDFLGCEFKYLMPEYKAVKIVEDNDFTRESLGEEMIDSNIVGKGFVSLLDSTYSQKNLSFYDTKCSIDFGSSTLKIIIIDKNRIGLYQDYNLIKLRRK